MAGSTSRSVSKVVRTSTRTSGRLRRQRPDRLHAAHPRHPQVEENHVHLDAGGPRERLLAVPRLADDLEVLVGGEHPVQPVAHDRVVVDEHEADRHQARPAPAQATRGTSTWTTVPSPDESTWIPRPPPRSAAASS